MTLTIFSCKGRESYITGSDSGKVKAANQAWEKVCGVISHGKSKSRSDLLIPLVRAAGGAATEQFHGVAL
jgi:hypothetical protein